jgi:hypothetical protein
LLEEGASHKEADADLNMRKAVHYVSACAPLLEDVVIKKGTGALDAQVAPASLSCGVPCHAGFLYLCFCETRLFTAPKVQAPSAITELYSTHFPYIEFQDCDGDHSKVIEKYVELYLKVPFVIAFIEKEMVKRGMDVNVGVHVFNSMWSNKEKKKHTAHTPST